MHNISSSLFIVLRRSAAFLYDLLLLIAIYFVITAIAIAFNDGQAIEHPLYKLLMLLVGFVFFDWFWRHGGQTLGMRAWRLQIIDVEGRNITLRQSLIRYVSGVLLFGVTLLAIPFNKPRMALHDQLSATKIIMQVN